MTIINSPYKYNYLLRIKYIGEPFHGLVPQINQKTIIGTIMDFYNIKEYKYSTVSRTDKGVNANENFVVISSPIEIDFSKFNNEYIKILNAYKLSQFINIRKFSEGKRYIYNLPKTLFDKFYKPKYLIKNENEKIIINSQEKDFDINKYIEASKFLIGNHNFFNFAKGKITNAISKIYKFEVKEDENYYINIIEGNKFYYEMIRRLITFLISCSKNLFPLEYINYVFEYKLEPKPFPAEPKYLTLDKVFIKWIELYNYIDEILI